MKLNLDKNPAKILVRAKVIAVARAADAAHNAEATAFERNALFDGADWALTFLDALQADGFAVIEAQPGRPGNQGPCGPQGARGMTGPQGPQGRPLGFLGTHIAPGAMTGGGI